MNTPPISSKQTVCADHGVVLALCQDQHAAVVPMQRAEYSVRAA